VVREVGLAQAGVESLTDEADRCFLKHYCVPLAGRDRRVDLPRCRPFRALALGFTGDLPAILRSIVDTAPTPEIAARKVARRLLLGVATIESAAHGTWSTDRATGAALLAEHHPQWIDVAAQAVQMSAGAPGDVADLLALGDWLVRQPDQWLVVPGQPDRPARQPAGQQVAGQRRQLEREDDPRCRLHLGHGPPAVPRHRGRLDRLPPAGVHAEPLGCPVEVEHVVEHPHGEAEIGVSGGLGDHRPELVRGDQQPGLLPQLPGRGLLDRLARLDPAAGGEPEAAGLEQQQPIGAVGEDHPR
jgi:hypothetical protein